MVVYCCPKSCVPACWPADLSLASERLVRKVNNGTRSKQEVVCRMKYLHIYHDLVCLLGSTAENKYIIWQRVTFNTLYLFVIFLLIKDDAYNKCTPLLLKTRQQREVTAKVHTVWYTNYYNLVRALTEMIDVYKLFLS